MPEDRLQFDFISDEALREGLEADYAELVICASHGAWKAVHVLAGSIVEALLAEYLLRAGHTKPDPLEMSLAQLIVAGKKAGVLTSRTTDLSGAVRAYRNLIHPGRSKRLGETADADGAVVAQALVNLVVRDISTRQQQQYGFTAEQIINKFASDPTAIGIAEHLLQDAPEHEVERLLIVVLPQRYFDEFDTDELADGAVLQNHSRLFRAAFDMASDKVKTKVTERYVSVLREEPGRRVRVYEEEFFRAPDLAYLAEKDQEIVKAHLLARLKEDPNQKLLRAAKGIGGFITRQDVAAFVDPLIRLSGRVTSEVSAPARELLKEEANVTPVDVDGVIVGRLEQWREAFTQRGNQRGAAIVTEFKDAYVFAEDDIPF